MYIYHDQNRCRCILKYVYCLLSMCKPLLSRKTVNRRCLTKFSLSHFKSRANASWPHPRSERNLSCLSKHILLPNFLCSVALASRCVLSVLFPELAYNRNPAPPYRMQLVEKKELPKLPLPANISTALPTTSVTMGRILGLEIIKNYTYFVGRMWKTMLFRPKSSCYSKVR